MAPSVVAVARDLDLGPVDTTLPRTPADPARLASLARRWRLESPVDRLRSVLEG